MRLQDMPIRRRLTLIILGVSLAVMVLTSGAFFIYEYLRFRQATLRHLSSLAEILATNSTAALAFQNQDDATEILTALRAERNIVAAVLYDREGRLFARYPAGLAESELPARPGEAGFRFEDAFLAGFQPVTQKGQLGTLFIRFDTGKVMAEFLSGSLRIGLAIMAALVVVAYLLARAMQQQIARPVTALADTARSVYEQSDFSVRAAKFGNDEVGLLTDAFNQMLGRIQDQNRALREHEAGLEQRVVERTAELEAANKELEAFCYSISHDLRAPLRHIDGFAQLLQKRVGATLGEIDKRYLINISSSAKGLGLLIDELLAFSRMGRTELRQTRIDVRAMVGDVVREFAPEVHGRNIEWRIGALPEIEADPPMLRQVWRNLLSNAIKYTRKREVATIEISHRLTEADGHVFAVRDNGAGFDMQYAAKLFGVFQRLHHANEFEGTGIGLANVRRIVHRHGGRIWAEGVVGEGATFYVALPNSRPAAPAPSPMRATPVTSLSS